MLSTIPLLVVAATVGILHMSAPDHWITLLILGGTSKWTRTQLMGIGIMTAVGHVALSILLGFAIIGLGAVFSQQVSIDITKGIGVIMIVGGLTYGVKGLRSSNKGDSELETAKSLSKGKGKFGKRFGYFAVLGAALSPDLSILPVFLLAVPVGLGFAVQVATVFAIASILALVLFLLLGLQGLAKAFERVPPEYNDAIAGFVIALVGFYVLLAG